MDKQDVTQLLIDLSAGRREALDELLPVVYQELRRIARRQLARERSGHTLDSVALVNEAYMKLVDHEGIPWQNRAHFFGTAARAMRNILIDYARMRMAQKRGGGIRPAPLEHVEHLLKEDEAEHLLALDEALQRLDEINTDAGKIVEYRYFGGLTLEEAAAVIGLSYGTARRRWDYAKAFLNRELKAPSVP